MILLVVSTVVAVRGVIHLSAVAWATHARPDSIEVAR